MTALQADESPGPGADAGAEDLTGDGSRRIDGVDESGGEIHFHFPIDIRLVGDGDDQLVDQVVARVFDELQRELERRA